MVRTIRFLLAFALAACALTAYADPPARVGRLSYSSGAVSLAPAEAPDQWTGAVLNRPLTSGDRLWADRDGLAEFNIGSTAVRMASQTSLDVLNLNDDTLQFRLAQGAASVRVRDLDPGDTVEIATPSGAVVIRQPGSYRVSVDPRSDTSRVVVNFGRAEVVTPSQSFTVPSGQAAVVPLGGAVAFEVVGAGSSDDFDRWSAERDRRLERVAATRYVSPQMTGYEELDQYGSWRALPEYGTVWVPTQVATGWAPYRYGHWVWVSPWGWTWIDDAPWGFAPSHYGRWVYVDSYWAWAPGAFVRRPVYAPALVAFVGGSRWSVSSGPAVGWFPLGWREPYIPWYRASQRHVHNVNVTNVYNTTNVTNINYVNRNNPRAVTVVSQNAFVSARPVAQSALAVQRAELARAEVIRESPAARPGRASFAAERPGQRPPNAAAAREVMAVNAPPTPAAQLAPETQERGARAGRPGDDGPRVRVIGRERAEARRAEPAVAAQPAPARIQAEPSAPVRAQPPAAVQAPIAPRDASVPKAVPNEVPLGSRAAEVERPRGERREVPIGRRAGDDATPRGAPAEVPLGRRGPPDAAKGDPRQAPVPPRISDDANRRNAPQTAPIAQPDRGNAAREQRRQKAEPPPREAPKPVPPPQSQAPREMPRAVAAMPEARAPREAPRAAAPQPQAQREAPRVQPQAQAPQAVRQQARQQSDERERPERRRGSGSS